MSNNNKSNSLTDAKINALVANCDTIQHDVLKEAATEMNKEARARQVAGLKTAIVMVDNNTKAHVRSLKDARLREAQAKDALQVVAAAQEAFEKDADVEAYAKAAFPHDDYGRQAFLRACRDAIRS